MRSFLFLAASAAAVAQPAAAQEHGGHEGHAMGAKEAAPPEDHQMHDMGMVAMDDEGHSMGMAGALGRYPMTREASGTAWQPDSSEHRGLHVMAGDWSLMAHGELTLVADRQTGPRGDDKIFAAGMLMGMARRPLGDGTLQLKAMVSPDPLMGKSGYPLLLASGETADGVNHLVDRQHPHDLFMELSASVSQEVAPKTSLFLYGGLPGEPAFGPPAFMHRQSISASPEAPITHHWLDSTHITFGVVTAGLVHDRWKLEASRFNGREPDQHRYNIETGPLDSTSARLSFNPTANLSLQASWAHLVEPEQLEPGENQRRWSASAILTKPTATGWWSAGLAWGRKIADHHRDDAFALEGSVRTGPWTVFARGEQTENRELSADHQSYRVAKASLGGLYDIPIANHLSLGLGAFYALNFTPSALTPTYGSDPDGMMAFARLSLR